MRTRRLLWLLTPVLILTPLAAWFHLQHRQLTYFDETFYFARAQRYYLALTNEGFKAALKAIFLPGGPPGTRDSWQPILHPALIVPSLLVTGGKVMPSVILTSSVFYVSFILTAGLCLAEWVAPMDAALGALLIASTPYVFVLGMMVMADIYFLEFLALSLLFLLRSRGLSKPPYSILAGICLGLAFCCRPVDVFMNLLLPLAWLIFRLRRRSSIAIAELLWLAGSACATLGLPLLKLRFSWPGWVLLLAFLAAQAGLAFAYFRFRKGRPESAGFFAAFALAQGIPFLFFLPKVSDLSFWIRSSLVVGKFLSARIGLDRWRLLAQGFMHLSGPVCVALAVLCLLVIGVARGARRGFPAPWKAGAGVGLGGFLLSLTIGAVTLNNEPRYFLAAQVYCLGSLLALVLWRGLPWRRFRFSAVLAICFIQLWHLAALISPRPLPDPARAWAPPNAFWLFRYDPPVSETLDRIAALVQPRKHGGLARIALLTTWNGPEPINAPSLLNVKAMELGMGIDFVRPPYFANEAGWLAEERPEYVLFEEKDASVQPLLPASELARRLSVLVQAGKTRPLAEIPWIRSDGGHSRLFLFKCTGPGQAGAAGC